MKNYVYIQDRAKEQTVKFEPWPHLIELLGLYQTERHVIILKARQLGISWLTTIYCLWKALFHTNVKVLFLSQGEEEAFDLIAKCTFLDNNLPEFLKSKREPDQKGFIGFPDTGSEIKALPSTERAGRSTDASVVVCDEWEFHPHAEANFAALKPTVDAGGQFIALSTADKTKLNTFFKQKFYEAKSGQSSFKCVFLGWQARPGRTKEWFDEIRKDLRPYQVEQEYPSSEAEALSTLKSRKFFDSSALENLRQYIKEPVSCELSDKYKGLVRIYQLPVVGRKYCIFADPSDGKEDPHAIVVLDAHTGEEVAESHGMTPADMCAQVFDELVRFYYNAFNGYELNARAGGIFSEKIKELGTPNQCGFLNTDGTLDKKRTGWWTGSRILQKVLWGLEEAVRLMQITPHSKECLDEFNQFMVPEGEDPQKPRGGADDYIDAWARAWHLRKYLPLAKEAKVSSFKYRET